MRLGFISDAHGNLVGFQRGLRLLEQLSVDKIFFLGDAIGYFPGLRVIDCLRKRAIPSLMGNHEAMLLGMEQKQQDRSLSQSASHPAYLTQKLHHQLSDEQRDFMASLRPLKRLNYAQNELLLVHASPSDPLHGYLYPNSELGDLGLDSSTNVVVMGHSHIPFVRWKNNVLYINAGSCGMPRGSETQACVALFDCETQTPELHRYEIKDTFSTLCWDQDGNSLVDKLVLDYVNRLRQM